MIRKSGYRSPTPENYDRGHRYIHSTIVSRRRTRSPESSGQSRRRYTPSKTDIRGRSRSRESSDQRCRHYTPSMTDSRRRSRSPESSDKRRRRYSPSKTDFRGRSRSRESSDQRCRHYTPSMTDCRRRSRSPESSDKRRRRYSPSKIVSRRRGRRRRPESSDRCVSPTFYPIVSVRVYWNCIDCPIPDGVEPKDIRRNVKTALRKRNYNLSQIIAYGYHTTFTKETMVTLYQSGITFVPLDNPAEGVVGPLQFKMMTKLYEWCLWRRPPAPVLLITGDIIDFPEIFLDLGKSGFEVLLAHNDETSFALKESAVKYWPWKHLAEGLGPEEEPCLTS